MLLSSFYLFRQSVPAPFYELTFICVSVAKTIGFISPFRENEPLQTSSPSFCADYPALHFPYATKQLSIIFTTLDSCAVDPSDFHLVSTCSHSIPLSCSLPQALQQVLAPLIQLGFLSHVTLQGLAMGCCVGAVWIAVSEKRAWLNPNSLNV
jgi:hypothetical protein